MAAKLIGLNNGVAGRVIAREQDDAAHRDEDQQEHESEKVKDQPERRNDTTEAKALRLDGSPRAFVERSIDSCRSLQPRAVSSA